jgi:hypothetical protein
MRSAPNCQSWIGGVGEPRLDPAVIERMGLKRAKRMGELGQRGGGKDSTPRIHTPSPFRELLISMARSVAAAKPAANDNADRKDAA